MAYNVSYSTLPNLSNNSIGKNWRATRSILSSTAQEWDNPAPISLGPGVYSVSANVAFSDSPNSYAYIICDTNLENGIWFTDGGDFYNMGDVNTQSGGTIIKQDFPPNFPTEFNSWYPLAGAQARNAGNGSSAALSLSTSGLSVTDKPVNITVLYNTQTTNSLSNATITAIRIA